MNRTKFLSICIPTYNRCDFLIKTLKQISKFKEIGEIEVVVADDGSTDGTETAVLKFKSKNKNVDLKFKRYSTRQFFDKMILSIVKQASGRYCWLISDDDIPLPGSISKLRSVINNIPNVSFIHMNYVRYDNVLKRVTSARMVGSIRDDINFDDADNFFFREIDDSYFKFLGTNIITMSTDVFNRSKWLNVTKGLDKFIGHNFIHCFAICTLIKKYPKIFYIGEPEVRYLSNNHRLWPNDIWKDYNAVFLNYLEKIGYSVEKIREMRKFQKRYERRESVMKNSFLNKIYLLARPIYVRLQFIRSLINGG